MFPRRITRTKKPDNESINWANPLSNGLKAFHLYNNGSGIVKDLCGKFDLNINNAKPKIIKDGHNKSLDYSPATSYANGSGDVFGALGFTVTAVVDLSNISTNEQIFICNTDLSVGASWGFVVQLHDNGVAGSLYARGIVRALGYYPAAGTTDLYAESGIHTISFRVESETLREIFVDGIFEGANTTSVPYPSGVDTLQTGYFARNGSLTNAAPYDGVLIATIFHNRTLSDIEIKSISDNPYQILQPRTQLLPLTIGVVSSGIEIFRRRMIMKKSAGIR